MLSEVWAAGEVVAAVEIFIDIGESSLLSSIVRGFGECKLGDAVI